MIHACWDEKSIEWVKPYLNLDNTLKNEFYPESAQKGTDLFYVVDRLLKGVEVELPKPYSFHDKDGKERHHIRVKWWGDALTSYRELAFGNDEKTQESFPSDPVSSDVYIPFYNENSKPVFFGHYWMTGEPKLQKDNVCCVDYSAGKGGNLVCYKFENPKDCGQLNRDNFLW